MILRSAAWLLPLTLGLSCREVPSVPPSASALHGCEDVSQPAVRDADGGEVIICALGTATEQRAVVWARIATPPAARPADYWSLQLDKEATASFDESDGRLKVVLQRSQLPLQLTIRPRAQALSRAANHRATLQLRFTSVVPSRADDIAEKARKSQTIPKGIEDLQKAAADEPYRSDPAAHARLLSTLADLEVSAGRHSDARRHYLETLALAAPAGLTTLVANSARHVAFEHYTLDRDLKQAHEILNQYEAAIRMIAIEAGLALYNRGIYAQESGDLAEAVRCLRLADAATKNLDDAETLRLVRIERALTLALQGLTQDAEVEIGKLIEEFEKGVDFEACDRMSYLNTLGWTRILEQESRSPGAKDPLQLLELARQYRKQDHCPADSKKIDMNQARAELMQAEQLTDEAAAAGPGLGLPPALSPQAESHLQNALRYLSAAAVDLPKQPLSKQLDAVEISGRIAYMQSQFAQANVLFAELEQLAHKTVEPDYEWRAIIGQAQVSAALARTASGAAAAEYTAAASAAFKRAETLLDVRLWQVPLTATRRAFLPRFTAGTAAFLDFLLQHGDEELALSVARRAQVRGLVVALSFDTLTLLPDSQQESLRKERDQLVRQSAQLHGLAATDTRLQDATNQLLEALQSHLRDAGMDRQLQLHALSPGEAMHLCHPLPAGELACFVATADRLVVKRLRQSQLQQATTPAMWSELLLQPFAEIIDSTRVLRVLPSQRLRAVDFAALPYPGDSGYLASRKRLVVHALDLALPAKAEAATGRGKALMLTSLRLQYAQKNALGLFQKLQQLGWQVTPYSNLRQESGFNPKRLLYCWLRISDCPQPLPLPVTLKLGSADELMRALPQVELAQLDTDADFGGTSFGESGWQSTIDMPNGTRLTLADLLMLKRAPRFTVLLVCNGGTAGTGVGSDDISLAQALLLRGGEAVVAASRLLNDELAAQWSLALYSAQPSQAPYLHHTAPDLLKAFHAAQITMRERRPSDWSTLRLFVP